MKLSKEELAERLVTMFPEKKQLLDEHCSYYNGLLGHVFFAEALSEPLIELILRRHDDPHITQYCSFIEDMWRSGDEEAVNIAEVTILERLSDDRDVWNTFGKHISNDLIRYINTEALAGNAMMENVPRLEYHK